MEERSDMTLENPITKYNTSFCLNAKPLVKAYPSEGYICIYPL